MGEFSLIVCTVLGSVFGIGMWALCVFIKEERKENDKCIRTK